MSALPGVRRRRTAFMLVANLLAIIALGGIGYAGVRALQRYEGATKVTVESIKLPVTPVGMLATVDDEDQLTSIAVFVLTAGTQLGGSIVTVPVSSDSTAGAGDDRIPLTQVYREGGAEALSLAVESVLSLTIDVSAVASPAEAESLLAPAAPLSVILPTDVRGTAAGGDTSVVIPAGQASISASQAAEVLTSLAQGQFDVDRRGNIDAVWAGVASSVGAGKTTPDVSVPISSLADLMGRLFSAPVESRGLPADQIAAADDPAGEDVETLVRHEAIFVLASVAPASMSAPSTGLVFRIEAPPGYEDRVKFAVRAILFLGGNVVSVYLGGDVHEATRYYIDDPRLVEEAESNNALFGITETLTPEVPIEGIDVILQLGTDFLNGVGDELPSTTTSTTEPA
ncbi:MAG: hypothetical protein LH616_11110 [Ilumatobacteraceae bacterium]|nr:hypothetical protein [Ilumatobacteraceae bacterium]